MKRNLKEEILIKSISLFFEKGYNNTSMRQIATACNITVGNLNYHYPKKEDLIMDYHNTLMETFTEGLKNQLSHTNPWVNYIAAEYSFIYYIASDLPTRKLYMEVINVPSLRNAYYDRHHKLFLGFLKEQDAEQTQEAYLSTVAMCSLEFLIIEKYDCFHDIWDFDDLMLHIFETRLIFFHKDINRFLDVIAQGIEKGKTLEGLYTKPAYITPSV